MIRAGDLIVCALGPDTWCQATFTRVTDGDVHATVTNPLNTDTTIGEAIRVKPNHARAADRPDDSMPVDINRKRRGHRFYPTLAQLAKLPDLYAQEHLETPDQVVNVRYFAPWGTWWITEFGRGPDAGRAYGYARLADDPAMAEWGTIWLPDIERHIATTMLRNRAGIPVAAIPLLAERDLHFRPGKAHNVIPDLTDDEPDES